MRIQPINQNIYRAKNNADVSMTGLKLAPRKMPDLNLIAKSGDYKPVKFFKRVLWQPKLGVPGVPTSIDAALNAIKKGNENIKVKTDGLQTVIEEYIKGSLAKISTYFTNSTEVAEFNKFGTRRRFTLFKNGKITVDDFIRDKRRKQHTVIEDNHIIKMQRFKHEYNPDKRIYEVKASDVLYQTEDAQTGKKLFVNEHTSYLPGGNELFDRVIYGENGPIRLLQSGYRSNGQTFVKDKTFEAYQID